ncbi:MAG: hypothetical protein WCG80_18610 [Spirochaetales bacterium]
MKRLFPVAAVFIAGVIAGALAFKGFEMVTVEAAFQQQKSELVQLRTELRDQEKTLEASRLRVSESAAALHDKVGAANAQAAQVVAAQGSAVERLKKVLAVLKQLEQDLKP